MEIRFITLEEFLSLGLTPSNVFGSEAFVNLNANRADNLIIAAHKDECAVVLGKKNDLLCLPWSAPYMALSYKENIDAEYLRQFGFSVREALPCGTKIKIVSPPDIYLGSEHFFISGFVTGADTIINDTSFHVPLKDATGENTWNRNARRNLRAALNANLKLVKTTDINRCYSLIAAHHGARGYNMAMTLDMVMDTAQIVPVDFWLVQDTKGQDVSAAFCYHVRPDVVQVINSGDNDAGREVGAMTFMARKLIDHYRDLLCKNQGLPNAILDYGPTSVNGVQNEGLERYKLSFGCVMSDKRTYICEKIFNNR